MFGAFGIYRFTLVDVLNKFRSKRISEFYAKLCKIFARVGQVVPYYRYSGFEVGRDGGDVGALIAHGIYILPLDLKIN